MGCSVSSASNWPPAPWTAALAAASHDWRVIMLLLLAGLVLCELAAHAGGER